MPCPPKWALLFALLATHVAVSGATTLEEYETYQNCLASSSCSRLWIDGEISFTGTLPTSLGSISGLTYLQIRSNDFTGTLPTELGKLAKLKLLDFYNGGQITGHIPTELGSLEAVTYIKFEKNDLFGPFPTELGLLTTLLHLNMRYNNLNGTIPAATQLTSLWLGHNDLSGTLPTELGLLTHITEYFDLSQNSFTGTIPTELGKLTGTSRTLDISNNDLTGPLPTEMGKLAKVTNLDVSESSLWPMWRDPCGCGGVFNFRYRSGDGLYLSTATTFSTTNHALPTITLTATSPPSPPSPPPSPPSPPPPPPSPPPPRPPPTSPPPPTSAESNWFEDNINILLLPILTGGSFILAVFAWRRIQAIRAGRSEHRDNIPMASYSPGSHPASSQAQACHNPTYTIALDSQVAFCTKCGTPRADNAALFCAECGSSFSVHTV
ncbi:hypothetical protein CYMTET_39577 [Cymbomonas tetramitiformis]|uniref:L domain-like protein n=1 Tax=Cymbomonas tetramitiformis TaxID=36881 RepID=A0AAE0CB08_9CHLO|nr:hypothetical protein CYMTET_39577 [Cymbomonas tetramitiformis]